MEMFSELYRKLTVPEQAYHYSTKTWALSFTYGLVFSYTLRNTRYPAAFILQLWVDTIRIILHNRVLLYPSPRGSKSYDAAACTGVAKVYSYPIMSVYLRDTEGTDVTIGD